METKICKSCLKEKDLSEFYKHHFNKDRKSNKCKQCISESKIKMQKHTKLYYNFFGYIPSDFVPSELSGLLANDINHIDCRGMGGSNTKDFIENLMAMTRVEHAKLGDISEEIIFLYRTHFTFMKKCRPKYVIDISKIEPKYRHELERFVLDLNDL